MFGDRHVYVYSNTSIVYFFFDASGIYFQCHWLEQFHVICGTKTFLAVESYGRYDGTYAYLLLLPCIPYAFLTGVL